MPRLGQGIAAISFREHELADGDVVRDWRHCASDGSGLEDHGCDRYECSRSLEWAETEEARRGEEGREG